MSSPSLPLQKAQVAALKTAGAAGGRVYDQVPAGPTYPYITVGEGYILGDDSECGEASDVYTQTHIWSQAVGFPEAKGIEAVVRSALRAELVLENGFKVTVVQYVRSEYLHDPDGTTKHVVVEHRYQID